MWSAAVHSLRHGETLYSLNSFRLQVPASNQKQLTAAVAAERLGWDYRYTTRIYATGAVDGNGALNGDLVVVSDGDPTINPRHPERWAIFDEWGKQLAAKGIRTITGHLIGDDNAFEEPGWSPGWAWDDLAFGYGAAASALQYHENQVELLIGPGREAGARAIISVSPPGSGLIVDHQVTTAVRWRAEPHHAVAHAGLGDADRQRPRRARLTGDHRIRRRRQPDRRCISTPCAWRSAATA